MRFPVFSKHSNPSIDRPLQRKKMAFLELRVSELAADWVDPVNHSAGIVFRSIFAQESLEHALNRIAGSGYNSAWSIAQSGPTGPLVWQMNT